MSPFLNLKFKAENMPLNGPHSSVSPHIMPQERLKLHWKMPKNKFEIYHKLLTLLALQ